MTFFTALGVVTAIVLTLLVILAILLRLLWVYQRG